jgi:hypothetical protein
MPSPVNHQLALRTDRVERLEKERPEQLLGRDRRPADRCVEPGKLRRQVGERSIDQRQDAPERVFPRHPPLAAHIAEQAIRPEVTPAHRQNPHLVTSPSPSYQMHRRWRLFPQTARRLDANLVRSSAVLPIWNELFDTLRLSGLPWTLIGSRAS